MNKNELWQFEDFIAYELRYITWHKRTADNDTIISKDFKRNGNDYILIARFDKCGNYVLGYLVNERGEALVNGKGFSLDFFLQLVRGELNIKEAV